MHPLRTLVGDFGGLVLPVDCAGCGRPGHVLCAACRAALAPAPISRTVHGLTVVSGLAYDGPAREVVLALKNHGRTDLAGPLATALRAALDQVLARHEGVLLAPMPATRRSVHERGFDPVRVVLRRARLPHHRLLALAARPRDQVLLGRGDRLANASGSMRAVRAPQGAGVVLVDDVVTTGATLNEAARVLGDAGCHVLGAATIAAVPKRSAT